MTSQPIPRRQVLIGGISAAALITMPRDLRMLPAHANATAVAAAPADSDFFRMLAFIPNGDDATGGLQTFLDRWQGSLSFANVRAAKLLYGFENVRGINDVANNLREFGYATNGCFLSEFTGLGHTADGKWRDAFGYDSFQIDREISAGMPPSYCSRMEGSFDADVIATKLGDGGYTTAMHGDAPYFTFWGDYQFRLNDPRSSLALGKLNRVAVSADRITAVGATATMEALLDAEAQQTRTLADSPTFRALAVALGDVTSMAAYPGANTGGTGSLKGDDLANLTKDWGTLHTPELTAMGYTDAGNYQRTMHVALVYANPDDAVADAPELVSRLTGYRSILTRQPLIPTYATAVTSRTVAESGKGVLVADVTLVVDPRRGSFWNQLYLNRDTYFLTLQPVKPSGTG
jgi:hypothetical protein